MTLRMTTLGLALLLPATAPARAAEVKPLPKDLPPFGEDKALPVPALDLSKLPNGLTVWIAQRPGFPRVTAVLAARGGTAADPAGLEGIAELLADTLKEGTAKRSARQIAEELQGVGGEFGASAGADALVVSASSLASGLPTLIDVLADVAQRAAFPEQEVELAKANALQALAARESTPEFLAETAFARAVYGEHPYHVVAATRTSLEAATPDALRREFGRRFRPDGSLLVVVGDLDPTRARGLVRTAFGAWTARGPAPAEAPASPPARPRRMIGVPRPGSVQSTLVVGRPVPTMTDPDYHSLLVANTIFAGAFGSRLVQNIREDKGYTYSPQGQLRPRRKGGLLSVQADVRNEVTGAAVLEVFYELDRMATTSPTDEELTKARRYQGGLYLLRNQLQGAVARTLASYWVNGLPPEALREFVPKVRAVTGADVRRVGEAYFTSASQTVVVVGEEARVKAELAAFGEVAFASSPAPAGEGPAGGSGTLVVLNKSEASASLIDVATGRAVATVATGEGPHEGATSPDGRTVLVTNYGSQKAPGTSLTVVDVTAGKAVGTIELGADHRPHGVRWLDARRALVTAEGIQSLLVVDVSAGRVEAAIQTGQDVSHMVAATPDGTRAFVANIGSGNVTAVDLAGGKVLAQIATGKGAEGIDVSPDGKEVWVTNRESDTISVVDAASLAVVATLPSASFPIRVKLTPDGKRALVSNAKAGDVAVFDAVARRELARIKMPLTAVSGDGRVLPFPGTVPIGIVITPDGSRAFVAHANADAVAVVDLATLAMTGSLKAGKEPDGMAYSPLRVSVR